MRIDVPDGEIAGLNLSPEEARLDLAVGLYASRRISLGRAARIAGIAYAEFMHELNRREITLNYRLEDAEHDLEIVEKLTGGRA